MATDKQIEANRINAQSSTGPRTDEGKAKSARNAARHGLCHTTGLMSDESEEAFVKLHHGLLEEHQPWGLTEQLLIYKMAVSFHSSWRASILLAERLDKNDNEDDSKQVALFFRYQTTSDRAFNRNLNDFLKLKKARLLAKNGFDSHEPFPYPQPPPETPESPEETGENGIYMDFEGCVTDDVPPPFLPEWPKRPNSTPKKAA